MYRIDADAIVDVLEKRTQTTPAQTILQRKRRLSAYDQI